MSDTKYKHKYLVAIGNLADGFTFYGPFEDMEDAEEWTTKEGLYDWTICDLVEPDMKGSSNESQD